MVREPPPPRKFFTRAYLRSRVPDEPPPVLFHFTRSLENALAILESGVIRGQPDVSTTENPALLTPGPVVFVLSADCLLDHDFRLWPCVWLESELQEAEWAIAAADSEPFNLERGCGIFSRPVSVPVRCVELVGYSPIWSRRSPEKIAKLADASAARGLSVEEHDWERWWSVLRG